MTIHTKKWSLGARFLGAPPISPRYQPVIWAENEHYFRKTPDTTFVDAMEAEFGYVCQVRHRLNAYFAQRGLVVVLASSSRSCRS